MSSRAEKVVCFWFTLSNRSGNDNREQVCTSRGQRDLILITRVEAAIPVIKE
jgi:hypothetical protein